MARFMLNGLDYMGDIGRRKHHHSSHSAHHAQSRQQHAMQRAQQAGQFVLPDVPGAPARDGALLPMGWPPFSFALATGTNIINQQTNVQTPFRGQRMVAIVVRNGTSAATTAPVISSLIVGQKPILVTPNGVGLEIFAQNAFDTNMVFPPTYPGVIYSLSLNLIAALTTTDTITCIVGVLGSALL
jgi:hypothetical protein